MSAYICNPDHIKALAVFASRRVTHNPGYAPFNVDPAYIRFPGFVAPDKYDQEALANCYADILYRENVRSVQARYPNESLETLPGPVDNNAFWSGASGGARTRDVDF